MPFLQHNCPVGNVDLQGRTALHDAGETTLWSEFLHSDCLRSTFVVSLCTDNLFSILEPRCLFYAIFIAILKLVVFVSLSLFFRCCWNNLSQNLYRISPSKFLVWLQTWVEKVHSLWNVSGLCLFHCEFCACSCHRAEWMCMFFRDQWAEIPIFVPLFCSYGRLLLLCDTPLWQWGLCECQWSSENFIFLSYCVDKTYLY